MRAREDPEELARVPAAVAAWIDRKARPGRSSLRSAASSTPIMGPCCAGCCSRSTETGRPEREVRERRAGRAPPGLRYGAC